MAKAKKSSIESSVDMNDTQDLAKEESEESKIDIAGPESGAEDDTIVEKSDRGEIDSDEDTDVISESVPKDEEERLRAKVAELEDRLLRSLADLDNHKKRSARQFDNVVRTANDRLLEDLLDISDNLDRALSHNDNSDSESIRQGTRMIAKQFHELLSRYHVVPVKSLGEKFDAAKHEALMTVESDEYPEGTVAVEIGRGYMIGDRVLRYAKVGVSKGPARIDESSNEKSDTSRE